MKLKSIALITLIVVASCKDNPKTETTPTVDYENEDLDVTTSIYPQSITKVFEAHGGLDQWNAMKSIEFTMEKPDGNEVTITNLNSRESLIDTPNHAIGYDGENPWFLSKTDKEYEGYDAKFYYNLMFYFYAMPFIVSDDGIIYSEAEPLTFEGTTYPGIKIGYESGVGESPEDEYIIYYHPETYKMEWLGYTVTYFSQQKEKEFHFRKYSDWQEVNGLLLPKTIISYGYENNQPTEAKKSTDFTNVKVSGQKIDSSKFKKPEEGTYL